MTQQNHFSKMLTGIIITGSTIGTTAMAAPVPDHAPLVQDVRVIKQRVATRREISRIKTQMDTLNSKIDKMVAAANNQTDSLFMLIDDIAGRDIDSTEKAILTTPLKEQMDSVTYDTKLAVNAYSATLDSLSAVYRRRQEFLQKSIE